MQHQTPALRNKVQVSLTTFVAFHHLNETFTAGPKISNTWLTPDRVSRSRA